MADECGKLQARFLGLTQEQRDVRIVTNVQEHIGLRTPQLGDHGGKIAGRRRVGLLVDDLHAQLPAAFVARARDADAVRPILVDDRDLDILDVFAELLCVLGNERTGRVAVLIGMDGRAERVLQGLEASDPELHAIIRPGFITPMEGFALLLDAARTLPAVLHANVLGILCGKAHFSDFSSDDRRSWASPEIRFFAKVCSTAKTVETTATAGRADRTSASSTFPWTATTSP